MPQSPMLCSPSKQTDEIDWVAPLKAFIRRVCGDDPEKYAEECNMLNKLRQDMRGAGRDSTAGRDLLYRYYGQLELLDLRFPVDENHIKISFTWYDAFTQHPTSQYSLAFEKASIIFNIAAILSCYATVQDRNDDTGQKAAYHSFQSAAGMFTYINENFLHAPSKDLSRDTVKILITLMLAQAQEVFVEKQIRDSKKAGLLAKLSSQAASLYAQLLDGLQENVAHGVFDRSWLLISQMKASYLSSIANYYQAIADADADIHGNAIARLQIAERESKDATRIANSIPAVISAASDWSPDIRVSLLELAARHSTTVHEKLSVLNKDNDFIYHQVIPSEPSLPAISKLAAAKAISVSELYQAQDIQRIIGPDIFHKIVPIAVTESASLYDEEKAKVIRAEAERVETAENEMAGSLNYLKLPGSLKMLKGSANHEMDIDEELKRWCQDLVDSESYDSPLNELQARNTSVSSKLEQCLRLLDQEESTCEKMRAKYGGLWSQQPSSRLTTTLRNDVNRYNRALQDAGRSDARLLQISQQFKVEFEEMRSAGKRHEVDVLYQEALIKVGSGSVEQGRDRSANLLDEDFGESGVSVADQIANIEQCLRKLDLVKNDRAQVLSDLKEKAQHDDISNVLILNKKSILNQEQQLFQVELEKFRPFQNRLLQSTHKQTSLLKELTRMYGALLQDKRVKSEQLKYEKLQRQQQSVMSKYRRAYQGHSDLQDGLFGAQNFYTEMAKNVGSLQHNVEAFVNNRRAEGAQLLNQIESNTRANAAAQEDNEQERLRGIMERMSNGFNLNSPSPAAGSTNTPAAWSIRHQASSPAYTGLATSDRRAPNLDYGHRPAPSPPGPSYAEPRGVDSSFPSQSPDPNGPSHQAVFQAGGAGNLDPNDPWAGLQVWK